MKAHDLKLEIRKSLDNVPESVLEQVLALLKQAESHPENQLAFANNLRKILSEDKELLERLAK